MAVPPEIDPIASPRDPTERFAAVEQKAAGSENTVRSASNLDDFDRSFIAKGIIWVYGGAIAVGFLLLLARAVSFVIRANDDWEKIATDAGDLIKTSILPIVTLVLGYYFGKSKS
jgi:hypothetical protein